MKKGISLVALLVAMVVMLILISTVTISTQTTVNNSTKIQFASEISYIQEVINDYRLRNNNTYPNMQEYSFDTKGFYDNKLQQFAGETISDNKITLYIIDSSIFGLNDLKYGNQKGGEITDVYLLSENTGRVYYASGLKLEGKVYYTLTDDLKKLINYTDNYVNINTKDGIVFSPSTNGWTNIPVTCDVKVPKEYTDVNVFLNGVSTNSIEISSNDDIYNTYNVKNVDGNYNITVTYNGDKRQDYTVTNYDNVKPTISISEIKNIVDNVNNSIYKYINILDKKDNLSGIKFIKYENSLISEQDAVIYFKSKGITVEDSIPIKDGVTNMTLYIEDNAGNYAYITINV